MNIFKSFLPGISRVFSNITPILIFFVFAQLINIEELGLLNYMISLITIVGIFTDFGIPEAIQRFLPQTKNKAKLITHTLKLEFLIVFIGALIFLILDLIMQGDFSKGYLALLTMVIIFSASNTIILIFNGLEEKRFVSKYFTCSSIIFLTITGVFYFALNFEPIYAFIYGRLISWALFTILPIYNLFKNNLLDKTSFQLKNFSTFNIFALNTFIYIGSITVINQWDSILITNIDGVYVNGIYKSVAFIATIPIVLITVLHTKLLPFFSQLNGERKYREMKVTLVKYTKYLSITLFLIYILQLYIYEPILNIFLKEEIVEQAGFLFPIIFLAVCIQILIAPFISTLLALGKERFIRNISLIQVLIFITASALFYHSYSYTIFPFLLTILNSILLIIVMFYSYTKLKICTINNI